MTNQEAIQGLKNLFSEHELTLPCTDSLEVLNMAIEALEKQIPKKTITSGNFFIVQRCPVCDEYVPVEANYCMKCGQKLDWSE